MNQNEVLIKDFHNNDQLDVIKDGVDKFIEGYKGECFVRHCSKKQNINFFEPDLIVNEKRSILYIRNKSTKTLCVATF